MGERDQIKASGDSAFAPPFGGNDDRSLDRLFRVIERRDRLDARERDALTEALGEIRVHPAGDTLVRAHRTTEFSTLLLEGLLARVLYKADGKRHIVALHVAGEFVDLHALVLRKLDHDVVALSDVRVALFPHAALRRVTEQQPHLTRLLWLLTMIDAASHREWIGRLGHSAAVRIAQLLCEVRARYDVAGICTPEGYPLPVTQADLGDMTGLTPVHVSRTLRKLREANLVLFRNGYVSIPDLARLQAFARFDPDYLYMEPMPR